MACLTPINIRNSKVGGMETVPCGHCYECRKRYASNWSFRLLQEAKSSSSAYFITYTYDTAHIHITKNGFMGLVKRDLQLYFKRLRKEHYKLSRGVQVLKYFAVGEYGGRTMRPHYHVILFNADLSCILDAVNAAHVREGRIKLDGGYQFTTKSWSAGKITIGQVSGASVGYTLKYICKPSKVPLHRNDDRLPEFALMSKGLGASYLTGKMCSWHLNDLENRMYCNIDGGKKISMPRYYKERIYNEFEKFVAGKASLDKMLKETAKDKQKLGSKYLRYRSEAHFANQDKQYRDAKRDATKSKI